MSAADKVGNTWQLDCLIGVILRKLAEIITAHSIILFNRSLF